MEKELTCIVCPMGCRISARMGEDGKVTDIAGNSCPRGATYVEAELTHPERTLTTTVRVDNRPGIFLPVKTKKPISKEKLMDAMAILHNTAAHAPIAVGDVILPDLFGEADIVATGAVE